MAAARSEAVPSREVIGPAPWRQTPAIGGDTPEGTGAAQVGRSVPDRTERGRWCYSPGTGAGTRRAQDSACLLAKRLVACWAQVSGQGCRVLGKSRLVFQGVV